MRVEPGSIEGVLAVDGHGHWIIDDLTHVPIRCALPFGLSWVPLLGKRVSTWGEIRTDDSGKTTWIGVEKIEQLPDASECPQMKELQAMNIDITGGVDSAEHVRKLRDGP